MHDASDGIPANHDAPSKPVSAPQVPQVHSNGTREANPVEMRCNWPMSPACMTRKTGFGNVAFMVESIFYIQVSGFVTPTMLHYRPSWLLSLRSSRIFGWRKNENSTSTTPNSRSIGSFLPSLTFALSQVHSSRPYRIPFHTIGP